MHRQHEQAPGTTAVGHYVDITTEVETLGTEPLVIACAADRQYAMPLAVMLRSVITNLDSRRALKVYIVKRIFKVKP